MHLRGPQLRSLHIADNGLGPIEAGVLADALGSLPRLTILDCG
jgi:hypothetical protein